MPLSMAVKSNLIWNNVVLSNITCSMSANNKVVQAPLAPRPYRWSQHQMQALWCWGRLTLPCRRRSHSLRNGGTVSTTMLMTGQQAELHWLFSSKVPLVDLSLLVPDLLRAISTEARLLSFAMPVIGFQSANGDLKNNLAGAGAAVASAVSGFMVMGTTPPGTTPSDVCRGTGARLCSTAKLLEAPWPGCVKSMLGLKRCLKLLNVPEGARRGGNWVKRPSLPSRYGTLASNNGGPGPMPVTNAQHW